MAKKYRENRGLENFLVSVIRWGTYLILFTPLIVLRSSFFPFVTPKTIYFRILVEIIFAAYLILAISFPKYRPKMNPLTISLFIFLGVLILTSITGINFSRSFWSTYERMTGLFTQFHLLAFFVVLVSVFKKSEDWEKLFAVSIFVGVLLSLYVFLTSKEISTRGGGTIGNSSFMATYLLFDIFFALILFLTKRDFLRIFSGISLLIMLPNLFTSSARGAIVTFSGGLILLVLGYLILSGKKNLRVLGIGLTSLFIISLLFLAISQPQFLKSRIEKTLKEMKPRFVVWETGWKGFLERPVLGWGPENFNVVFLKYFNPCLFLSECGGEIWFDRAHNIVLDTLVTTGIVGFLSYLAIFASAFYGLLKICFNPLKSKSPQANNGREEKENLLPALGMAVLLIVYFLQNLLVFDMISSYTVFFLSLGFIGFLTHANSPTSLRPSDSARVGERTNANFFGAVILVLTLFLLYFGNIQPAKSAINTVKMIVPQYNLEQSINFYEKALNTFMEKYEIREQFAQRVYYAGFGGKEKPEVLKNAFDLAEKEMEKSIEKNPLDFRSHLFFGKVYFSDYYSFRDVQKLNLAENIFLKAIELSPTNQQGYWHLGEVKMAQGKTEEGISLFQKAIDLEPRLGMSHWYLAIAYKNSGQLEKARQEIEEAERLGYNFKENLGELERAIEVYQALKDDKKLVLLYQEAIKIQPNNYQFWANLAASYANLGEFEKAKEAALKVKELKPDLAPRVEEFLKSLK